MGCKTAAFVGWLAEDRIQRLVDVAATCFEFAGSAVASFAFAPFED